MIESKYQGYFAGGDGHIYSILTRKGNVSEPYRLAESFGSSGYAQVAVKVNGKFRTTMVHSLICETYHGERPVVGGKKYTCSHLNGNNRDNRPENLKWESHSDNHRRKVEHGTDDAGWKNSRAKLSADDLVNIRRRLEMGDKHKDIADDYGVARATISKINNRSRYASV